MTKLRPLDLELSRNLLGRLTPEVKARVSTFLENPTEENWDNCYGIIVGANGWTTLWKAVMKVDPTFPTSRPAVYPEDGSHSPWPRVPTRELVLEAIRKVTRECPTSSR